MPFAVNGDEVLFFSRALRMAHGQVLYRDIFELVTPGTELLYSLGFRIFGMRAWIPEGWHIVLGAALCLVITAISRTVLMGSVVFLPTILFLAFDLSSAMDATHHWWSTLAALSAVAVLLRGREPWRIAVCGVLCGAAILFTQTQGMATLVAIAIGLCLETRTCSGTAAKRLALLVIPCVLLCGAVLGYYASAAGMSRLISDVIVFPVTGLSGPMNSPGTYFRQIPTLYHAGGLLRLIPFVVVLSLTPYCYLLTLLRLRKRDPPLDLDQRQQIVLLSLVGLALFAAVSSGPRFFRICTVALPAFILVIWNLDHAGTLGHWLRPGVWAVAALSALCLSVHRQIEWSQVLQLPTGTVAVSDPGQWQELRWLQGRTSPGEPMFNDPEAILYLGLRNPMPVEFVNDDDFTSPQEVRLIVDALKRNPARYVALDPNIPRTSRDHAAPFRRFVHEHYCREKTFMVGPTRFPEELWRPCEHVEKKGL